MFFYLIFKKIELKITGISMNTSLEEFRLKKFPLQMENLDNFLNKEFPPIFEVYNH